MSYILNLKAGRYTLPTRITEENSRLFLDFPYNKDLLTEIKNMQGRKYHGYDENNPRKIWSIPITARNLFQLYYLAGKNPYAEYDKPLLDVKSDRPLYAHQFEMKAHAKTRKRCIFACEMRTGKTLPAIEIIEESPYDDWLWVGPKSALAGVQVEFKIWKAKKLPRFMTYRKFTIEQEAGRLKIPQSIVFDECSFLRNPTSKRSVSASIVTGELDSEAYILMLSGSPAPKDPSGWWFQAEIACPGYLVEGDIYKFKRRMGLIVEKEGMDGGNYPHLVTWWDNEKKCKHCGKFAVEHTDYDHTYEYSVNEVSYFYKRAQGLVLVKFKEDCLDLPEKQFRIIELDPGPELLRLESMVKNTFRGATKEMKLRELSDGFQYAEEKTDQEIKCPLCKGSKIEEEWFDPEYPDEAPDPNNTNLELRTVDCSYCSGKGVTFKINKIAKRIKCAKDDLFIDLLEEHEPIGRFVAYAAFTDSVLKLTEIAQKKGWDTITVNKSGWVCTYAEDVNTDDMLLEFLTGDTLKLCFIGNPGAAGMGIDLASSPSCFFYSNSTDAEHRIQAQERIHGPRMNKNRGATIIDVFNLPVDKKVYDNIQIKMKLMHQTMGK